MLSANKRGQVQLASEQPGVIGIESAREDVGIPVLERGLPKLSATMVFNKAS